MTTLDLPPTVTSFHISDCNSSTVTVTTNAFEGLNALENVIFQSIASLVLEPHSIHPSLVFWSNFTLSFDHVLGLSLQQNAIRIEGAEGPETHEKVAIRNSFITHMEEGAIIGNLSEVRLEQVIFSQAPGTRAIDVGTRGTSIVINHMAAASGQGLRSEWIKGHASQLNITNSNLTFQPNAFAGVYMMQSSSSSSPQPQLILRNNQFGFPKWFPGSHPMTSVPSLPSGSLDLRLPDRGIAVDAANNQITCECSDLTWLYEEPATYLKTQVQSSLQCLEGRLPASTECHPTPSSAVISRNSFSLIFSLALVSSLLVWGLEGTLRFGHL